MKKLTYEQQEKLLELYRQLISLKTYVIQLVEFKKDYQHIQDKIIKIVQEIDGIEQ